MRLLFVLLASVLATTFSCALRADSTASAIQEAQAVMHEFMRTFNSRDESAWADTLLFPHVRVASGGIIVSPTKAAFVEAMDFEKFAAQFNWSHSHWDEIEVIQAGPEKVHFKVTFSRFNPQGEKNATFNSLYVVQKTEQGWGMIRMRSSFAP